MQRTTITVNGLRVDVEEARDWLLDLTFADVTEDDIEEMSGPTIVRAIQQHYSGGVAQFVADGS